MRSHPCIVSPCHPRVGRAGFAKPVSKGSPLGTSTDVRYRRVSGWIWLMPDRRTIWLHDQGAQEPVVFYTYPDGKRRELVITNVTQDSASGYLLLPEESGQGLNAALTPVDSHFDR